MRNIVLTITFFSLFACSPNSEKTSFDSLSSESTYSELSTSIVQLRSAIASSPESAKHRYLLAKAYLYQGKYDFAEKEINRYLEFVKLEKTSDENRTVLEIYFLSENFASLQDFAKTLEPTSEEADLAKDLLVLAGYESSSNLQVKLYKAMYPLLRKGKTKELSSFLSTLPLEQTTFVQRYVASKFYFSINEFKLASAVLDGLHKVRPNDTRVIVLAAISHYKSQSLEEAEYFANLMLKADKDNPIAMLIKASGNFKEGNYSLAEQEINIALSRGIESFEARLTAALVNYQLGNFEKAYNHFKKIEDRIPRSHLIYRYVTATKLMVAEPIEAYNSSKELEVNDTTLPLLLSLASKLDEDGKKKQANELLNSMKGNEFIDGDVKFALDSFLKSRGQVDTLSLESSFAQASKDIQQKAILITTLLSGDDEETALKYLDKWLLDDPKSLELLLLKVASLAKLGNEKEINETISEVEAISPGHPLINSYRAVTLLKSGNRLASHSLLKKIITKEFYSPWAVELLINSSNSKKELVGNVEFLASVYNDNQGHEHLAPTLDLAFAQASADMFEDAIATVERWQKESSNKELESRAVYELKTVLHLSLKQYDKAKNALFEWKSGLGVSKEYLIRALTLADLNNDPQFALLSIEETKTTLPKEESDNFSLLKTRYLLKLERLADAISTLNSCSYSTKKKPLWKKLKGQTLALSKDYKQASVYFLDAYKLNNSTEIALYLMQSYFASNQRKLAENFALQHLELYPKDSAVRMRLAELLFNHSPTEALRHYEYLDDNQLATVGSLNNQAWLLLKMGENPRALVLAKRAYKDAPTEISVLDTYLKSLVANAENEEALKLAESLYSENRESFEIGLIYIKILYDIGEVVSAEQTLKLLTPNTRKQQNDYRRMKDLLSTSL